MIETALVFSVGAMGVDVYFLCDLIGRGISPVSAGALNLTEAPS